MSLLVLLLLVLIIYPKLEKLGLLQHHSSGASILGRSAFFAVWLSHLCMATGEAMALTGRTFVGKVVSLLFTMLSRSVNAKRNESMNIQFSDENRTANNYHTMRDTVIKNTTLPKRL